MRKKAFSNVIRCCSTSWHNSVFSRHRETQAARCHHLQKVFYPKTFLLVLSNYIVQKNGLNKYSAFAIFFICGYCCGKKQAATYRFNRFTVQHNKNPQTHTATEELQCLQCNNKTVPQWNNINVILEKQHQFLWTCGLLLCLVPFMHWWKCGTEDSHWHILYILSRKHPKDIEYQDTKVMNKYNTGRQEWKDLCFLVYLCSSILVL